MMVVVVVFQKTFGTLGGFLDSDAFFSPPAILFLILR